MSLQVCHCGWTKVTSYQGLRTHQGKKGCTPKGMHIPENKGLSFLRPITFMSPQMKDPALDRLTPPWNYDFNLKEIMSIPEEQLHVWRNPDQQDSTPLGSTPAKEEVLQTFTSQMYPAAAVTVKEMNQPMDVKLDSTTAHQCLVLSDDGKKVRDGGKAQGVPDFSKRFDMYGSILGLNSFTSGRSYWEVEVSNKTGWDLGVARGDANRKGKLSLNPDNGYWVTVHYEDKRYAALSAPPVSLSLKQKPQKVGVFVDYEEGLVSFYDVTTWSHIYSFTECLFGGEIFPYFSPHLKQNGKNSEPLIISAVETQKCL